MSTPKHALEETVRTQIHLIHEADPISGAVIQRIIAAAEEYAQARETAAEAFALFGLGKVQESPSCPTDMVLAMDRGTIIGAIKGIREPLLAALPRRE